MTIAQGKDDELVSAQAVPPQAPKKGSGYFAYQSSRQVKEKRAIAKYVVKKIIEDGMSIFLDAGSTVHQVGLTLFNDTTISGLMIMTNNMLVFNEFTTRSKEMSDLGNVLALAGGVYNQNHEALFGQTAEQALKSFNPQVVVIGASGFMVKEMIPDQLDHQGAFHHDLVSEIVTKKAIVAMRTLHRVIVCDYRKIGVWDASCFATIQELNDKTEQCTIVTSIVPPELDDSQKKRYEERYRETRNALKKLAQSTHGSIKLLRVDYNGEEEA